MSETSNTSSGGVGFFGLLFLVFLVLKLCGVIAWSWWWVTAPLWMPLAAILVFALFWYLTVLGQHWIDEKRKPYRRKSDA